jgi:hypothetical protein
MRSLIPVLGLLAGCVIREGYATKFVPTNGAPQPMRPRAGAEIPIVSTAPNRPFVEVGFIEGWPESGFDDESIVLARMRGLAGRLGCDVLLITGVNNDVSGHRWTSTMIGYHGACLVYGEAQPGAPLALAPSVLPTPAPPPAKPAPTGLLFKNSEGNLYRVQPEARDEALRAGWVRVDKP